MKFKSVLHIYVLIHFKAEVAVQALLLKATYQMH